MRPPPIEALRMSTRVMTRPMTEEPLLRSNRTVFITASRGVFSQ